MGNRSTSHIAGLLAALAMQTGYTAIVGDASGTGPSPAVAEQVDGLPTHTIYHPQKLPDAPLPLFVWGNGACRDNGLAYGAFLRQVASHGYFIVSVGRPREERPFRRQRRRAGNAPAAMPPQRPHHATRRAIRRMKRRATQLLEAIDWATRENARADGPFKGRIDLTRIAVGGHSCGGLQALAVSDDPRIDTTLVLNSGIYVQTHRWPQRRRHRQVETGNTAWADAVPHRWS